MAELLIPGIQVVEQPGPEHAIARASTAITAFVGRALRGPCNQPVALSSFTDFQRLFGGLWQPSMLGYAVEQFFENGGRAAIVVRVSNDAQPKTLTLPAAGATLTLKALCPGTREFLRASVDYDNIGENETDRFNLVVQRIRTPGSEFIEDQEIYRRLSIDPLSARSYVPLALSESHLVRMVGEVPVARPDRTLHAQGGLVGYVQSNPDGDDGAPPTDYDIIGSAAEGTGLHALRDVDAFNFLCIPPLARETDVGPSTLMIAARLCRERRAMLIVDPPASWTSASEALEAMHDWYFASQNALMYFPRVIAHDRLRGRHETFAPCGAVAGMLARVDEAWPVWSPAEGEDALLRAGYRPICAVTEQERARLTYAGINTLQSVRSAVRLGLSPRTLCGPSAESPDWKYLSARRLALFIINSIECGTRWVLFERNGAELWRRVEAQLEEFLAGLDAAGAFIGREVDEAYFVVCDERLNDGSPAHVGCMRLLVGFAAARPGDFHTYLITHGPSGSRSERVSCNRLLSASYRLNEDIDALDGNTVRLRALGS
jgi:phage tail sheath protein FI